MPRPRHPRKELEAILRQAEEKGWRVEKGKGYYKMKCPCPLKHLKSCRLTPSNANYARRLLEELGRMCWEDR